MPGEVGKTTTIRQRLRALSNGWDHPDEVLRLAEEAAAEIERLHAVIRANALRWAPRLTHAEIDEVIHGRR